MPKWNSVILRVNCCSGMSLRNGRLQHHNIGEQVYQLSKELKDAHPEIPWSAVSGLRHRLVHDYDGVNWNIIVEVIFEEMEPFVKVVREIQEELNEE